LCRLWPLNHFAFNEQIMTVELEPAAVPSFVAVGLISGTEQWQLLRLEPAAVSSLAAVGPICCYGANRNS